MQLRVMCEWRARPAKSKRGMGLRMAGVAHQVKALGGLVGVARHVKVQSEMQV